MLPFEDRFTRQRQLREVGLAGQQRIEASRVVVGSAVADTVAADYLRRAGVHVEIDPRNAFVAETGPEVARARAVCAFSAPADYLAGTLTALGHLRSVLGVGDGHATAAGKAEELAKG